MFQSVAVLFTTAVPAVVRHGAANVSQFCSRSIYTRTMAVPVVVRRDQLNTRFLRARTAACKRRTVTDRFNKNHKIDNGATYLGSLALESRETRGRLDKLVERTRCLRYGRPTWQTQRHSPRHDKLECLRLI